MWLPTKGWSTKAAWRATRQAVRFSTLVFAARGMDMSRD
jgi:hypothetical protein